MKRNPPSPPPKAGKRVADGRERRNLGPGFQCAFNYWLFYSKRFGIQLSLACLAFLLTGCSDSSSPIPDQPKAEGPALYGPSTNQPSSDIPRARAFEPDAGNWKTAAFSFVQTELSPATLYHSSSARLSLFSGMEKHGLGGPTHLAFSTRNGPRSYVRQAEMEAAGMEENWLLVWFAGAKGWTNWDSPWAVFLQHKPTTLELDEGGLHLTFPQAAGDVVVMPLYGYLKFPLEESDFKKQYARTGKKRDTWKWIEGLRTETLMRLRYWASATREFPLYCEDTFSVNRNQDSVTLRQTFFYHSIPDDWNTRHLKVAPLSPPLAQASMSPGFPVSLSQTAMDFDYFTPYGPYWGIQDSDHYEITFPVLSYVHETEKSDPPNTNGHPEVIAAVNRLREVGRQKFDNPDRYHYDHGGLENFSWAILGDQWYAKALPYYDAVTRSNAASSLRRYFYEDALVTNRFKGREYPKGSGQHYFLLEGPSIGPDDEGRFSANVLETIWAYAHFTGDWELIRERWPLIKRLFTTPAETRWISFGRTSTAELGEEAAPCLAMARLAYRVGDLDAYHYACYQFARELVHHWLKQRGAGYFREHQPMHSMEDMEGKVYLTSLHLNTGGWRIDGPTYPKAAGKRQFADRWVRFNNEDVARFYRDFLKPDVQWELDQLQSRWEPERRYLNESHRLPSLLHLRSLLLNEPPEQLAQVATPDQFQGPPSGIIANCLAMIRTSHPTRLQRLIPPAPPSPFVTGLEREVIEPSTCMVQSVQYQEKASTNVCWPEATWPDWKTPTGDVWSFGQVSPDRDRPPKSARAYAISWNAVAVVFE